MSELTLWKKLIEVRKTVGYLQKENKGFQYQYVSSSQVLEALRGAMNEQGVLLIPNVTEHAVTSREVPTKNGTNIEYFTEIGMTFTWVNADNPEEREVLGWYAQGVDVAGEKGVGKALTYAEKYLLLKFFNIATDKDDPDAFQEKSGNGNGNSRQSDVQQAQYDQRGEPANAAAERHAQTPPDPESITDFNTFAAAMVSIGVDSPEKMAAAKIAAGYAEDKIKQLDPAAWQNIYGVAKAAKEAAA